MKNRSAQVLVLVLLILNHQVVAQNESKEITDLETIDSLLNEGSNTNTATTPQAAIVPTEEKTVVESADAEVKANEAALSESKKIDETIPPVGENVLSETKEPSPNVGEEVKMSNLEEQDDLQTLKEDVGEVVFKEEKKVEQKTEQKEETKVAAKEGEVKSDFEGPTTDDEKEILQSLKNKVKGRISNKDWTEILQKRKVEKYEVKQGDTLKSIAKILFGSEDLYSKIWSLNPQITNPNNLEAGTILTFDSGDFDAPPNVQLSEFSEGDGETKDYGANSNDESNTPPWIKERKKLIDQGVYFQFASEETYEDLEKLEKFQRNTEYEKYDPPLSALTVLEPSDDYDSAGFDKNSRISFKFKEGFFLNSFVTTNVIQDLGEVSATKNESVFIHKYDTVYVKFDKSAKVKPGDLFTTYTFNGEARHVISDRSGFMYTTTAQIRTIKKIDDVWECYVYEQSGILQRRDRVTVFTPKINKIAKTLGKRSVEAAIIATYRDTKLGIAFGDVVYLDRGRADGVELGNQFDVYAFTDRGTERKISATPTYKVGELTVINITDNFATALVTNSKNDMMVGSIALMKTQEDAMRELEYKNKTKIKDAKSLEAKSLEELDVELNLDDVSQDILNKADRIQLTEDEIEELDRKERDKSIIKDSDRDVKELDRLESEIYDAEKTLNESKLDEDKFLEQQSLEEHEKKSKIPDPNAFESINEIEKDIGRKYLDEDLNNKENPYGLTEFDLEEIDELLNTDAKKTKSK